MGALDRVQVLPVQCVPTAYPPKPRPLRSAVLVWDVCETTLEYDWRLLHANGDESVAREIAARWLAEHPEGAAQLMITANNGAGRMVSRVEWL